MGYFTIWWRHCENHLFWDVVWDITNSLFFDEVTLWGILTTVAPWSFLLKPHLISTVSKYQKRIWFGYEVSFSGDLGARSLEFLEVSVSNFETGVLQSRKVSNSPFYNPYYKKIA